MAKKFHGFTFKISIDYILRGLNLPLTQDNRMKVVGYLRKQFTSFVGNYSGMSGADILHYADFKHKSKLTEKGKVTFLAKDKNGNLIPDDWHMHFGCWGAKTLYDEANWRKRLAEFDLNLSDANRTQKDFRQLKKSKLPSMLGYWIHRTPQSIKDHKHAYSEDEMHLINFSKNDLDDYLAKVIDEKDCSISDNKALKLADELTFKVRRGATIDAVQAEAISVFGEHEPQFWRSYSKKLEDERNTYLKKLFQQLVYMKKNFNFIYVDGSGGIGKSYFADQLGFFFADSDTHAVHTAAATGKGKTPDMLSGYSDELVTVAHEMRPTQFNVEEFLNDFEPNRYSMVSARNQDKRYFAQAFILAKAMPPQYWAYSLFYSDLLVDQYASRYYHYEPTIKVDKHKQTFAFPKTYAQLLSLSFKRGDELAGWQRLHIFRDNQESLEEAIELGHHHHWSLEDAKDFIDQWWQIIRRIKYTFKLTKSKDNEIKIAVYCLNTSTRPACLANDEAKIRTVEEFFDDFTFENHYFKVCEYEMSEDDFYDMKQLHQVLKQVIEDLKEKTGLKIADHLPRLLSPEELTEKLGEVEPEKEEKERVLKLVEN